MASPDNSIVVEWEYLPIYSPKPSELFTDLVKYRGHTWYAELVGRTRFSHTIQTLDDWDHLAIFNPDPLPKESDPFDDDKKIGELRPGDVVCYFHYPYAFNDTRRLVWDQITSIKSTYSKEWGDGAALSVAGAFPIDYDRNRTAVYRYDEKGQLVDVTGGKFVSMELLHLTYGKIKDGTYYSGGNRMADTLRCQQVKLNEKFVAEGNTGSTVELLPASAVKEDTSLAKVMHNVVNQYITSIKAHAIVAEAKQEKQQEEQVAQDFVEECSIDKFLHQEPE